MIAAKGVVRFAERAAAFLGLVFLGGLLAWGFRVHWLSFLGERLILEEAPRHSDVIVVLSGASVGERIRYAAELYRKEFASKILLAGQMSLEKETGVDLMKQYLEMLGVPRADILRESESETTLENAMAAKERVMAKGYRSLLLVTSPIHTRRTKAVFRKVFPPEIRITIVSDRSTFPGRYWWAEPRLLREVSYEYLNLFWFWVMKLLGGNPL